MEKRTFNMRNPSPNEVLEMHQEVKKRRAQQIKYKLIRDLFDGKTIDLTKSAELYEALNREKMEFEQILKLHPQEANEAMLAVKEDREFITDNVYWNRDSPAKWAKLGHIPPCLYNARPPEYWSDKRILKSFFNSFTKFRISTKPI